MDSFAAALFSRPVTVSADLGEANPRIRSQP